MKAQLRWVACSSGEVEGPALYMYDHVATGSGAERYTSAESMSIDGCLALFHGKLLERPFLLSRLFRQGSRSGASLATPRILLKSRPQSIANLRVQPGSRHW